MTTELASPDVLTLVCANSSVVEGIDSLVTKINNLMPGLDFEWVLTRGGWHRLGGVVDAEYLPVSSNIAQWVEEVSDGDIDELLATYMESGYFATHIAGKTHFITAVNGDDPDDFIQIEIEELQEVLDRPLVQQDWFPDSIEEFLDPLDYPRLEPEAINPPYYRFRRITSIKSLIKAAGSSRQIQNLRRFLLDWQNSSAMETASFCRHWVLALREYKDREGYLQLTAKPVPTIEGKVPELPPVDSVRGLDLANAINSYDRELGYPFAWYFMLLGKKSSNHVLADAVLADQMGAYEYLPSKDLQVLRDWEKRPYGV